MRGCKGSGMFQCREAKAERGCVAAYKNVRGVNTREELLMLKDNIGMRTSENKLVMNKCRLWTTERFVTMGGEQLGFCFPKGALEHKQSWFCVQHHFCLNLEVPSHAGITPQGVLTSTSRINSAGALCFLPFSAHLQQWGGEMEQRAPCSAGSAAPRDVLRLLWQAQTTLMFPQWTFIYIPGATTSTVHLSRDTEHLTCLIGITLSVRQIQKNTGKWMFGGLQTLLHEDDAAWAIILPGASVQDHFLPYTWHSR